MSKVEIDTPAPSAVWITFPAADYRYLLTALDKIVEVKIKEGSKWVWQTSIAETLAKFSEDDWNEVFKAVLNIEPARDLLVFKALAKNKRVSDWMQLAQTLLCRTQDGDEEQVISIPAGEFRRMLDAMDTVSRHDFCAPVEKTLDHISNLFGRAEYDEKKKCFHLRCVRDDACMVLCFEGLGRKPNNIISRRNFGLLFGAAENRVG